MKVSLFNYIEPSTYRQIFTFEVTEYGIRYCSYGESRRNDYNDIWGDEWTEFYYPEKQKLDKEYDEYLYDDDNYDPIKEQNFEDMANKMNPIMNKTKEGKSYYTGMSGPEECMPKIPWSLDTLKRKISQEISNNILPTIKSFPKNITND